MVCFPALQFNTAKKQFMATRKVPITVSRQSEDLSFTSKVFEAKAVAQILASNLRTLRFLSSAKSQWRVPASWQPNCLIMVAEQLH
jgi:hypothetical protein